MPTIAELHQRTLELLQRPPNDLPVELTAEEAGVAAAPGLEALGAAEAADFQHFLPSHLEHAMALVARFMELANQRPGDDGLAAVLEAAARAAERESMELVRYALMVFITHHPEGRRLPIPPLDRRVPAWVVPSRGEVAARGLEALGALGDEALLDYFREDTAINDHHGKWHVVYPAAGVPDADDPWGPNVTKDRQGELFWYMHQQMLARYDTERRAFGLDRVAPLEDYRAPIPEGYDANLENFSHRRPDELLRDVRLNQSTVYAVDDHEERRDRHVRAAEEGFYRLNGHRPALTPDLLGSTLEANAGSAEGGSWGSPFSPYGNHHNFGHVLLASLADPDGPFPNRPGVMNSTLTAVRDPVFWRWHRHVDDLFFLWQERLPANEFEAGAPPVRVRDSDLILCLARDVPGSGEDGFDGPAFAAATFGGDRWDEDPAASGVTTDELLTTVREEEIELPGGETFRKPYLDHEEFAYVLRLENRSDAEQRVTVRVFLAAAEHAEDRRSWIEMDKFAERLDPGERRAVYRPARHSSVARKPARRPHEPRPVLEPGQVDRNYCDCGWPYHLLLPRGTEDGMPFRLLVMLTDWEQDLVGAERKCGSMSFCGARDADYPDSKPMGYPFDRAFTGRGVAETAAALDNWAARELTIRHLGAAPDGGGDGDGDGGGG